MFFWILLMDHDNEKMHPFLHQIHEKIRNGFWWFGPGWFLQNVARWGEGIGQDDQNLS